MTNCLAFILQPDALKRQPLESVWREGEKSTLECRKRSIEKLPQVRAVPCGSGGRKGLSRSSLLPCLPDPLSHGLSISKPTAPGELSHGTGPFTASKQMLACTVCSEKDIQNIRLCNKAKNDILHTFPTGKASLELTLCILDFDYISFEN